MKGNQTFPLVISGPSGCGKSTIRNELLKYKQFRFSITYTTRPPRKGEVNGKDYYFITEQKFDRMIKKNMFLEWAYVHNWRYGTPKKSVIDIMRNGYIPIMTIDVKGAVSVKKIFKDSLLIFVIPTSYRMLLDRLKKRGESKDNILLRMKTAIKEMDYAQEFDYLVINDKVKNVINSIKSIIYAENSLIERNIKLLHRFKSDILNHIGG